jgi:hypothetical protein
MTDVGNFPFKQARDFQKGRKKNVRLIGVHATATREHSSVAENIQRTWATDDGRLASTQVICDDNSTVRCVHDADTAFAAKGANADGEHVEIVGMANQTGAQYADAFSEKAIRRAAVVSALWCKKHGIPVRRLTVAQIKDGVSKGFAAHSDIQKAFPSTGHTDPGPNFPWSHFLALVRKQLAPATTPTYRYTKLPLDRGDHNADVGHAQTRLKARGFYAGVVDNDFGPKTEAAVRAFQEAKGLLVDGVVGPKTAAALG